MLELKEFTWKKLIGELEHKAPLFLTILRECSYTRTPRPNQDAVIGMCAAITQYGSTVYIGIAMVYSH